MYLCTLNYDLCRGGTFEITKAGTFHSVMPVHFIPLCRHIDSAICCIWQVNDSKYIFYKLNTISKTYENN